MPRIDPRAAAPAGRFLLAALGIALLLRLLSLGLYPVSDPTEARYAEMARVMAASGDWVTPWYDIAVPFWGKPPLSIWLTAASLRLVGFGEFGARLPHWLLGLLVSWLTWDWLRRRSQREAVLALAMLGGAGLFFVASGAVMTDMALLLGTTLVMRGFWQALHGNRRERRRERWLPFAGVVLGLLAKGPVALLLVAVPIGAWTVSMRSVRAAWQRLPWVRGILLTTLFALPWYAWAEQRTPGFLDYFLLGEHWARYTEPGWNGDRYGSAHVRPMGSIWIDATIACLPWTLLVPLLALGRRSAIDPAPLPDDERRWRRYLLAWSLAAAAIFTPSRNILWTYVLPSAPALAALGAAWLARDPRRRLVDRVLGAGVLATALLFASVVAWQHLNGGFRSAREVVAAFEARRTPGSVLVFVGRTQYSAAFYTRGEARRVDRIEQLMEPSRGGEPPGRRYVALLDEQWQALPDAERQRLRDEGRFGRYRLFEVPS